jgi:hypothetical protein
LQTDYFLPMKYFAYCLCLIAMLGTPGLAQTPPKPPLLKPLKLSVRPLVPRARSQAPQTVDIRIGCISPKLFTGRLVLKWYLNKKFVHEYVSHEITVTEGGYMFRLLVPQVVARAEKTPISVDGQFVMDGEVIVLDEEAGPNFPPVWKRAFVTAVVQPAELQARRAARDLAKDLPFGMERGLAEALNLEQFNPIATTQDAAQPDSSLDMLTYPARLTPEDMPIAAEGYASFDLLLLEGPGFEQLKPKQLAAIEHWVAGGGSIVVRPFGKLARGHADFLNRLAGFPTREGDAGPGGPGYTIDEEGQLVIEERARVPDSKYSRHVSGLGRSLIIHEPLDPQADFSTPAWKKTVAFLWKVRDDQRELITGTGFWNFHPQMDPTFGIGMSAGIGPSPFGAGRQRNFAYGNRESSRPYAPIHDHLARTMREFLLPERIEGVPLSIVAVILGLYLLAVAPGDYCLLGRINGRKYTWWLFIGVSAAFTWCTVLVAQRYMGRADYHTSLVFADMAEWGDSPGRTDVVRTNRFDMLFKAEQTKIEIAVKNTLYTDLTDRAVKSELLERERDRGSRAFAIADNQETDVLDAAVTDLPVFEGVMPSSYSVHQQMRQWSPRINRQTTLRDEGNLLAATRIDWDQFRPDDWHTPEGRVALRTAILAREPKARVLLFHKGDQLGVTEDMPNVPILSNVGNIRPTEEDSQLSALIRALSVRAPTGFFAVVSQVAPTGGEYLEDMALLDASDSRQWLLAVAVRRENEWIVYRKLYR